MGQRDDLTLPEAGHVLWERRALVAGCTLLFLAAALLYGTLQETIYTAGTTLSVRLEEGTGAAENFGEILSGLQDTGGKRGLVVEEAARRAGWEAGQDDFNGRLWWEPLNDEEVEVYFRASSPEDAVRAADAYAEVVVERIGELKGRLAGGSVAVNAEIEDRAEPQRQWILWGTFLPAAATLGGLLLGGAGALFLEGRARQWSGSKDAELTLRAPVLGVIPEHPKGMPNGLFSHDGDAG